MSRKPRYRKLNPKEIRMTPTTIEPRDWKKVGYYATLFAAFGLLMFLLVVMNDAKRTDQALINTQARLVSTYAVIDTLATDKTQMYDDILTLVDEKNDLMLQAHEATMTIRALEEDIDALSSSAPAATPKPSRGGTATTTGWNTARASWYGPGFYGKKTASGAVLTQSMMNFAHNSISFGTRVEFEYNGRTAIAVCNDTGGFAKCGREFDLGPGTATALGFSGVQTIRWRVVK